MARAPKGTPTALNVSTLRAHFAGREEAPNQIEPTSVSGIRRCFSAGLVEVSADRRTLRLTEAGKREIALLSAREAEARLAMIARTRRPTEAETAEAAAAYAAAAVFTKGRVA